MTGMSGNVFKTPSDQEIIPVPEYSQVFYIPDARQVAMDIDGKFSCIKRSAVGKKLYPAACFLPPGYLRLYLPAYKKETAKYLPLWAYSAMGINNGKLYTTALKIDDSRSWDPDGYDDKVLIKKIDFRLKKSPKNRLLKQLKYCATKYHCFTAKNVFLEKNECALVVSDTCNASCIGCISHQNDFGIVSSQHRIDFTPTVEEVLEVAMYHIDHVRNPILSFGQGCEGEPLLKSGLIEKIIMEIRKITGKGTININTNGSLPKNLRKLAMAGLDSVRISLNSMIPHRHKAYYRPRRFDFRDVMSSVDVAKKEGLFVSLNLLTFPGVTDEKREVRGIVKLLKNSGVDMVQLRNLNIDPYLYLKIVKDVRKDAIGLSNFVELLKTEIPKLRIGYFNISKEKYSS